MNKRALIYFLIILTVVVACLHMLGVYFQLYWRLPGYDKIPHIASGFLVSLAFFLIFFASQNVHTSRKSIFVAGVLISCAVGILWELFELRVGLTALSDRHYFVNNGGDVVTDIIGGILASYYFINRQKERILPS